MLVCSGCGAPNRDGEGACARCGQVFEEETSTEKVPLLRRIVGTLAGLVAIVLVILIAVLPGRRTLKTIVKIKAAEERQEQKEQSIPKQPDRPSRVLIRNDEAPDPQPKPVAPPVRESPSPKEPAPPAPHQVEGQAHLRRAEDLFARGDYPRAAEAYQIAERSGVWTLESRERRKTCADIAYVVMYREYMDREKLLDPARLVSAKANLERIDPSTLPGDSWRVELGKTQARVEKAHKELVGGESRGSYAPQPGSPSPPAPKPMPEAVWKNMKFLLKPLSPEGGKIEGAEFTEVASDGLAGKAGIRVGDVLVEINDQPVTTMNQVINLRTAIDRDRGWWGVVRRGDQRVPFRVEIPGGK